MVTHPFRWPVQTDRPSRCRSSRERLAIGFDLDMTLIDTAPGFGAVLNALGDELGVEFAVEEMTAALGPPLDLMLRRYLPAEPWQRRATGSARSTRTWRSTRCRCSRGRPRRSRPCAATAAGSSS